MFQTGLLLLLAVVFVSCGIKGPPLPPLDSTSQKQKNVHVQPAPTTASTAASADKTTANQKKKETR